MVAFHPTLGSMFSPASGSEHDPFGDGWLTNPFQKSLVKKIGIISQWDWGEHQEKIYIFETYSHTTPIRIPKDLGIVWETYLIKGVPCPWGSLKIPLIFIPLTKVKKKKRLSRMKIQVAPQGNRTLCVGFKMKDFLSQSPNS